MCLLVVAWRAVDGWPLIVGANRDEWLDRPATAVTVLQDRGPRILGGRDERAGGTWMAVNRHGVVCGLTNRPLPDGPDPSMQSRGRLPLVAARARSAVEAVDALVADTAVNRYNPAWLLVADRDSAHYLAVGEAEAVVPRPLGPGLNVLENSAYGEPSVKVDHVRAALTAAMTGGSTLWESLPAVLRDHRVPDPPAGGHRFPDGRERRTATLAPCVHTDGYGTRSSAMVRLGDGVDGVDDHPQLLVADGPPCTAPFVSADALWSMPANG